MSDSVLHHNPLITSEWASVSSLRRMVGYARWRVRTQIQSRHAQRVYGDVHRLNWISPQRISAALHFPNDPSPIAERGVVRDGDWDLHTIAWESFSPWIAFCHRFRAGGTWQQTQWYQSLQAEIASGKRRPYNCGSAQELDRHFRGVDALYDSIYRNGYKPQSELTTQKIPGLSREDEISVHIDRHGRYLFGDGRHRLCIAKLLGIKSIPVKVSRRHTKWVRLRQEILDYVGGAEGRSYQPLLHPDLADIPCVHGPERFELLRRHLPISSGSLLDLGANWGYFCHRFEEIGFDCTAVESFPTELHFLRRLRDAEDRRFAIERTSILDLRGPLKFDVVLGLNIFHHFIKEKRNLARLLRVLGDIDAKVMFFEPHNQDESQMAGSFRNYGNEEFAMLVAGACRMESRRIGQASDGRPIYMLVKPGVLS